MKTKTKVREEYICDGCGYVIRGHWRDAEFRYRAYERGRILPTTFVFHNNLCRENFIQRQRGLLRPA
jgi:transcription initiation factor TFIIIB Brf1 subunit/transcription initiation factor TFIIB